MNNARRKTHDARRNNGFTLLELLIAASIFSIIIVTIYSAFQTGFLSYRKVDSAFEVYQTARIILNRMELDLKNSFAYVDAENNSWFKGGDKSLEFFSVIDSYKDEYLNTNVCLVKYELSDGILKRTCYKGIDALKSSPDIKGEELSFDIKEALLKYAFPTGAADKPYDWQDLWPSTDTAKQQTQKPTIPLAVKIELSLIEKDYRKKEVGVIKFNKTVSLPLANE